MQPTTLKEDILSIYIREDDTSSIIMKKIDNYCLLHSKFVGVRFAIKFYYLFFNQLKQNNEKFDCYSGCDCGENLVKALDIAIIVFRLIFPNENFNLYINTFLSVTNHYITDYYRPDIKTKTQQRIIDNMTLPYWKIAIAFSNAFIGYDKYVDKDGDVLFMSDNFRKLLDKDVYISSASIRNTFPLCKAGI